MESFSESDARFRQDDLLAFVETLLRTAGANPTGAQAVARAVVDASARGVDTHGVRLVPHYVHSIEAGRVNTAPRMRYETRAPSVGHLDADDGFGHEASYRAIDEAIALASTTGIAAVAVERSSHHGATGCYTLAAAQRGYAAIAMTHADAIVVPHGGVKPFYSTNPISFAVPVADGDPLLLDMATSSIPWNRVLLRRATGTPLPPHVAVDGDGTMTTDPHAAAALLPVGGSDYGYKGAGLAAMVDVLCSAFTGAARGALLPSFVGDERMSIGHFFIVLRPEIFQPLMAFDASLRGFLDDLRAQPAKPGARVMAPGDPEWAEQAERRRLGIPVDAVTWAGLQEMAGRYGCAPPGPRPAP